MDVVSIYTIEMITSISDDTIEAVLSDVSPQSPAGSVGENVPSNGVAMDGSDSDWDAFVDDEDCVWDDFTSKETSNDQTVMLDLKMKKRNVVHFGKKRVVRLGLPGQSNRSAFSKFNPFYGVHSTWDQRRQIQRMQAAKQREDWQREREYRLAQIAELKEGTPKTDEVNCFQRTRSPDLTIPLCIYVPRL
jgi:hypothetical protein